MTGMILKRTDTLNDRLDCIARFVIERENIRKRRARGEQRPWTKDEILATYHFCNVRRADDRVTKFIGAWAKDLGDKEARWFNYAVARWFNEPEVLTALRPALYSGWNPHNAKAILKKRDTARAQNFRGAYIITGAFANKGQSKYEAVVDRVLTPLWTHPPIVHVKSIEDTHRELMKRTGFGSFMAGQVVADWQTFGVIRGNDVHDWAPLGPGSAKGLFWIFEPSRKISQEMAIPWMQQVHQRLVKRCPDIAAELTLHDVQNCLCEFSKYTRGWSKTKFTPHQERLL